MFTRHRVRPPGRFAAVVGLACWALPGPLHAQAPALFAFNKPFRAEQVVTTSIGQVLSAKVYFDGDKLRNEVTAPDLQFVTIAVPAEHKVYSLLPAQKIATLMDFDLKKLAAQPGSYPSRATYKLVGPDKVEGKPALKYQGSGPPPQAGSLWTDPTGATPIKMVAGDGSYTIQWKDYHAGPQPAALFRVPPDYHWVDNSGRPLVATPASH